MSQPIGSLLWRSLRAYQVYGANTDVGKTIFSTILAKASKKRRPAENVWFLKPVSTGPLDEADDRHVSRFAQGVSTHCLHQFEKPISPHLAALSSAQETPSDSKVLRGIRDHFVECAQAGPGFAILETAGGVHSPGPSGASQADLYRPLRLPVVLIADSRLGGISSSISAYESLRIRGYDVASVMLFHDAVYQNDDYLRTYFDKQNIPSLSLPFPPERKESLLEDEKSLATYYEDVSSLPSMQDLLSRLDEQHENRINRLQSMPSRALECIWYPFTQHQLLSPERITTIDSASGDFFQTSTLPVKAIDNYTEDSSAPLLKPSFDGSASWWTQGLGHANPELVLAAAYAAGRYGHVMFAEAVHEPALSLAEMVLKYLNNPRMSRVFYTDNGSAGAEVAIKMGLRAARLRYGWSPSDNIEIIGLQGSYHGDTMGVMDCAEPSVYNEKVEWYQGRGFWFDYPKIKMANGSWVVEVPENLQQALGSGGVHSSLTDIFDVERREHGEEGQRYQQYIIDTLEKLQKQGRKFGALVMEPVILGAGGMLFADPLFQRMLVRVVRENPELFGTRSNETTTIEGTSNDWSGLPVIFDEVFTGFYRLGRASSSAFLGVHPDVSIHAKLLTGGVVPLCVTVASEPIFNAFDSAEKTDALLHGHSYTAHPIGCKVAEKSLQTMNELDKTGHWDVFKLDWIAPSNIEAESGDIKLHTEECPTGVWSVWSKDFVTSLSLHDKVRGVFAIGSVLAIELQDPSGGGYTSTASKELQSALMTGTLGDAGPRWDIHCRVLGNVLYLMASQMSTPETVREIEALVRASL
ncbi:PLP-dependent transferase [Xylona heveae TC161]|uniref:PLP-dependent transferase n=1 Tax=Xylona heveae (strain CBS 132557 / TC161) TaxID=1328760 RepID=A0A165K0T3_XYLHT|nr:PLP-dependent transferase [Xylona heveae TC161]KZF26862.1 PLP-dependent transferase [Xylona heveae TC161]